MIKQFRLKEIYFYWTLCLGVLIYLLLRAIYVPIVHDEAATYFFYINSGDFIPYYNWANHADANNHILNSALAHLTNNWFGDNLLSLRLPNLLSSILLFIYVWKLGRLLKTIWVRWTFILSLLTSYYFLEFFSLARGYGMSMAFMVAALYHLIQYAQNIKLKDLILVAVFMLFGTLANLTLINTHLIIFCIILLLLISRKPFNWRHLMLALLFILLPIFVFIKLGMAYQGSGLLYYGQGQSFYDVTVLSLVNCFTHISATFVVPLAGLMLIVALGWGLIRLKQDKLQSWCQPSFLFWLLFWGNVALVFIQIIVFEVNYPEDRTALYFFPLMVAMLCFSADISRIKWHLIPLWYFPVHLLFAGNIHYNYFWISERQPERFYNQILEYNKENKTQPTVGGYHLHKLTWDYYNYQHGGLLNSFQQTSYPDTIGDFQIARRDERSEWKELYQELDHDKYSKLSLYQRNRPLDRELFYEKNDAVWKDNVKHEYINFHQSNEFDIGKQAILAEYEFDFDPADAPVDAWVVLQVLKDNEEVYYEYFSLERYRENFNRVKRSKVLLYTNVLPAGPLEIRCYIWNLNREELTITNGKLRLYYLE